MLLNQIIKNAPSIEINQLSCDSRIPMKDCIFFCIKGIKYDGHHFVDEAINNGAKVIVYSDPIDTNKKAIFIKVNDVLNYLNKISNIFYENPQSKLFTYLVAGTYGRPSVTSIITDILRNYKKVGSIGVYGINYGDNKLSSSKPTLTVLDTQKYLNAFVKEGVEYATLEANNISFDFRKLNFLKPNIFVYTNTSQEKIKKNSDYISTIQRYLYTLDDSSLIILNKDDMSYEEFKKASGINTITYGRDENSDYVIKDIYTSLENSVFNIRHNDEEVHFTSNLIGIANVYNVAAAIVALCESGVPLKEIAGKLSTIDHRPGIYEKIKTDKYNIIVDAAFYKESYEQIMSYIKGNTLKKVISIISLSTSDDVGRISNLMRIAEKYSDQIIVTEDSNYDNKIEEVLNICPKYIKEKPYLLIDDRVSAIEEGIDLLNTGDTLLILGKGNENYINKGFIKENYAGDANIVINYLKKVKQEELLSDEIDY